MQPNGSTAAVRNLHGLGLKGGQTGGDLPPFRVGLIIAVPKAAALPCGRHPKGFGRRLRMAIAEQHVGLPIMPISHPVIAQGQDGVREDNCTTVWECWFGVGSPAPQG